MVGTRSRVLLLTADPRQDHHYVPEVLRTPREAIQYNAGPAVSLPEPQSPNVAADVVNTLSRSAGGCRAEPCRVLRHFVQTAGSINRDVLRVMVIAALAWCPILAPRPPQVLAQAHPAPTVPLSPAARPEQPNGLPRARDYESIPELQDIYFDLGAAIIRPVDTKILDANAAWLRAHPAQLVLIEGHCECTTDNEHCWRQNRRSRFLVKPR